MSTMIEYLSAIKKYKRVIFLMGHGQSDSVSHLLDWRKTSHFEIELEVPKIKSSILKDLTCEDLIEKHAILDVMHYGVNIFKDFETKQIWLFFYSYKLTL